MKNILLCFVTDSKDFDFIDKKIEEIKSDKLKKGLKTIYTYTAVFTKQGLTSTDTDEIEYILQTRRGINYITFALKEEHLGLTRKFSLHFIDKGYIVFFSFY